jgi:hypothetical protein
MSMDYSIRNNRLRPKPQHRIVVYKGRIKCTCGFLPFKDELCSGCRAGEPEYCTDPCLMRDHMKEAKK